MKTNTDTQCIELLKKRSELQKQSRVILEEIAVIETRILNMEGKQRRNPTNVMNCHWQPKSYPNNNGNDWCHLCGSRRTDLMEIWYPENAEHGGRKNRFIRICYECTDEMGKHFPHRWEIGYAIERKPA